MSTFVIGDVHGSRRTLERLMGELPFDEKKDRLWMVGDLVNRGADSLGVLRWALARSRSMGDRFVAVLGNHDLHLLGLDAGLGERTEPDLDPVLRAPDRRELLDWLRARPFLHREKGPGGTTVMVHAGLWPRWTVEQAAHRAKRLAEFLESSPSGHELLRGPKALQEAPGDLRRLGDDLYAFTSLRTLRAETPTEPCRHKGKPEDAPAGCVPWFEAPGRRFTNALVIFGHWAALGLHRGDGVICVDSGCAWNGPLTALCLEDDRIFQVPRHPADAS